MAARISATGQNYSRALALGAQAALTACCWMKISTDRNTYSSAFFVENGQTDNWGVQTGVDGTTLGTVMDGTSTVGPALTPGTWYFIALATSGTTGTLYTRAAGASSFTTTAITGVTSTNAASLLLGESPWGAEWLNGCLAAVKLWTAQLTAAEVEQEWLQYVPRRFANLVSWHPLIKTETADYSGNARTLSGGTGTTTEDGPPLAWLPVSPRLTLPASGNATPAPAAVAGVVALPQAVPSVTGTGTPAAVAAVVAAPQATPTIAVTSTPAAVAAVVAVPQAAPSGAAVAAPAAVAAVVALPQATPQTAGNVTATPATITAVVGAPSGSPSGAATALPATVAAVAALPQPAPLAGGNATVVPATVSAVVAAPTAVPSGDARSVPGVIVTTVAVPRPAVGVAVGPSAVAVVTSLPLAVPVTSSAVTRTPSTVTAVVAVPRASTSAAGAGMQGRIGELSPRTAGGVATPRTFELGGTIR